MHRRQERIFTGEQRPNVSNIIAETALTHVIRLSRDSGRQQLGHITNLAVNGLVDLYIVPAEIPLMSAGVSLVTRQYVL